MALRWLASLLLWTAASGEEALEKLQIRVLDTSGAIIAGANVSLKCRGITTQLQTPSDALGMATFTVPPTTCTAVVSAEKFETDISELHVNRNLTSIDVQLRPLGSKTEIVVAAGPGANGRASGQ